MSRRSSLAIASAVLAAVFLAAPAAAQWVGGERSTIRRAEQPPPVAGGVNLTDYCQRRGYYSARVENGSWVCVSENGRLDVDMDAACRDVFGADARARPVRGSPPNWICYVEAPRPADMGEGAATASPGNDAGVAPTNTAPGATSEAAPAAAIPESTAVPGVQGTVAPPILGVPPLVPPPTGTDPQAPAADAPTGPLALWTGLPFYARAVIAGLGALVLGLLLGTLLRRKGG